MSSDLFLNTCERLMRQPAVAYHEEWIRAEIQKFCLEHGLDPLIDTYGNIIVTLNTAPQLSPLALVAHMDHPGFEMLRPLAERTWEAQFLGGVPPTYFRPGIPIKCFPSGQNAFLGEKLHDTELRFKVEFSSAPAVPPEIAVWDLVPYSAESGRIKGRACDDLIGVAAILTTLATLKRSGASVHIKGLITRAEEVGFHGTLLLAQSGLIPKDTLIVSLETSRELPPAQLGQGVIIRVGDKTSIFESRGTRYLTQIAAGIQERDNSFRYQRALMSGGTCEATAFQEFGYRTVALCVALGNYHNCGSDNRILEEYVSMPDAQGLVRLLIEVAGQFGDFDPIVGRFNKTLATMSEAALKRLAPAPAQATP